MDGLYIHIPFCRSKCPYCDFYSIASTSLVRSWIESLKKEILLYAGRFGCFDTIYLGGGTPSLLETGTIEEIFDSIAASFNLKDGAEITVEANPGDMTPDKIAGIKSLGINRINLGIQSFNDRDLLFLGRRHSAADCERAIKGLRDAGFDNVGIDLIYGLKDQTPAQWIQTMEKALSFSPEHISCYQLTIEGKTVFNAMKNKGTLKELSEDSASRFFLETSDYLEQHGYIHYEVSNFAKNRALRSGHNMKYWQRIPYLGLGPSAHSFDGKKRWWNFRSVRKYCLDLESGKLPVEDFEVLSEEQEILEKVSLGLRTTEGVMIDEFSDITGAMEKISGLVSSGHIEIKGNIIVPTKKGLLIADQMPLFILEKS